MSPEKPSKPRPVEMPDERCSTIDGLVCPRLTAKIDVRRSESNVFTISTELKGKPLFDKILNIGSVALTRGGVVLSKTVATYKRLMGKHVADTDGDVSPFKFTTPKPETITVEIPDEDAEAWRDAHCNEEFNLTTDEAAIGAAAVVVAEHVTREICSLCPMARDCDNFRRLELRDGLFISN